jgi:hypothetical protein
MRMRSHGAVQDSRENDGPTALFVDPKTMKITDADTGVYIVTSFKNGKYHCELAYASRGSNDDTI